MAAAVAALVACGGNDSAVQEAASPPPANIAAAGVAATFSVTDASSPIAGTTVSVPDSAVSAGKVQINITYEDAAPAPLRAEALAEGAAIISKTIVLTKDRTGSFNSAVSVTVPYDRSKVAADDVPSVLFWDEDAKAYQAMAVVDHDAAKGLVTFRTVHFSRYVVAVIKGLGAKMAGTASASSPSLISLDADSNYRPSVDGFFHTNINSYSSPGGNCLGMASYADWFYERAKTALNAGKGLIKTYLEGDVAQQDDDLVAEELIVRAHAAASQEWARQLSQRFSQLGQEATAAALLQALKLTGRPQVFLMWGNPTWFQNYLLGQSSWGHAVVVYRYSEKDGIFYFDDNNARGGDDAGVHYVPGKGFTTLTKTGNYSPEPNQWAFDSTGSVYSPADMRALYDGAAAGWSEGKYGSFKFNNITVDPKTRIALVNDRKNVRLQGTVVSAGGTASVAPNTVDLYISGKKQGSFPLANNAFDISLPALPDSVATTDVALVARCDSCDVGGNKASVYGTFARLKIKAQSALDNIGFEGGDFTQWTTSRRLWDGTGVVTPSDKSVIVKAGFDPIATSIATVLHGKYSARVNNEDNGYHISTVTRDVVVPADGSPFALNLNWAAVLEDPQHNPSEQPYVNISVKNLQTGEVLYQRRYFANDPTFAGWKSFKAGQWKAIDWQPVPLTSLERFKGHTLRISVEAADCSLGGHGGYAYLDAPE
jgi:hypothetical protein